MDEIVRDSRSNVAYLIFIFTVHVHCSKLIHRSLLSNAQIWVHA